MRAASRFPGLLSSLLLVPSTEPTCREGERRPGWQTEAVKGSACATQHLLIVRSRGISATLSGSE